MAEASPKPAVPSVIPDSAVTVPNSGDHHHGIPTAVFFDDIAVAVEKNTAPALIEKLSALSQKYRFFEEKLVKSRASLEEKIAEVQRALKAVRAIAERTNRASATAKDMETQFELSDGLFVKASIPNTDKVSLWLGANIMVEYTHPEAIDLLCKNLKSAKDNYEETCLDINYLRDQLNTTDVNLSRVYNHHVQSVRGSMNGGKASTGAVSGERTPQ